MNLKSKEKMFFSLSTCIYIQNFLGINHTNYRLIGKFAYQKLLQLIHINVDLYQNFKIYFFGAHYIYILF